MSRNSKYGVMFCIVTIFLVGQLTGAAEIQEAEPMGPASPAMAPEVIDTGLGEDGLPYLADHASFGSEARSDWLLGKVEPAVEDMAESQETVDVIIYLSAPPSLPDNLSTVDEVKAQYRPVLNDLSRQIGEIVATTRP